MTVIEHAMAHAPLRPSYPGSPGRYGGRHYRRHPTISQRTSVILCS